MPRRREVPKRRILPDPKYHDRMVANAGSRRRSLAMPSIAAASLPPQALPAVIENPSISG